MPTQMSRSVRENQQENEKAGRYIYVPSTLLILSNLMARKNTTAAYGRRIERTFSFQLILISSF